MSDDDDRLLQLIQKVKQSKKWCETFRSRQRSIACNQQKLVELHKKNQRLLEFLDYYTRLIEENSDKIGSVTNAIEQCESFCREHESKYVKAKQIIEIGESKLFKRTEKLIKEVSDDNGADSTQT